MKIKDAEILIVPGEGNASPFHWQTRWEDKMSTARRVVQDDWDRPRREAWVERLVDEVDRAERRVLLVAHSVGVLTVAYAAPHFGLGQIAGAFLVGASDWERPEMRRESGVPRAVP